MKKDKDLTRKTIVVNYDAIEPLEKRLEKRDAQIEHGNYHCEQVGKRARLFYWVKK
jgi:hypothetical protein